MEPDGMELAGLELTDADLAFRSEVRNFFATHLTPDLRRAAARSTGLFAEFEYGRKWQKILYEKGWGAHQWPVEYGGPPWTSVQRHIWEIETARARPPKLMLMGHLLCGPCIMQFGTPEQKAFFLPRIASGDDWWAQGYSEPGAGSDLASLQLSAVSDGDEYVLNGSKIWTTYAHHANRIFLLVRTDRSGPKHVGITFLLVDMESPGIDVRPILNIAGEHDFNQVFFTNVRVPKSRRLGKENEGWTVVRHSLGFEHGSGLFYAVAEVNWRLGWVNELAALESDGYGGRLLDDADFSRRLALLAIDIQANEFASSQLIAATAAGEPPSQRAELLNIRCAELSQALAELAADAIGYYGLPDQRASRRMDSTVPLIGPDHTLLPMPFFLSQRALGIAGGTFEIHRNNIAKRLLGL